MSNPVCPKCDEGHKKCQCNKPAVKKKKFAHGRQPSCVQVHTDIYNDAVSYIEILEKENSKLREGLEFYAKPNASRQKSYKTYTYYSNDHSTIEDAGYVLKLVGKKAREILRELK